MKKRNRAVGVVLLTGILLTAGCGEKEKPLPNGIYESEKIHGYTVQMTIDDDFQFVEYIDSRPVQSGTYSQTKEEGVYSFEGDKTSFDLSQTEDGELELYLKSINSSEAILLKKTGGDPKEFEANEEDVSHYRTLLEE